MRRRATPISLVLSCLAAAACQGPGPATTPTGPAASKRPASRAPGASPGASPANGLRSPAPIAGTGPTFRVPSRLLPPAGGGTALKGRLTLDATYLVAAGAGNALGGSRAGIVGADGGKLVDLAGKSLISDDGSTLISDDGSTLISDDGSTLISDDGSTLISDDGSTLISDDGSTLISDDGSTLISDDGSTLVANAANQIVAAGGGNLVAPAEARLIGADGATLIGADGGSLIGGVAGVIGQNTASVIGQNTANVIGQNTANVIGQNTANVIGQNTASYQLAQAGGPVGAGDGKPVAGALIGAFDLTTGAAVPVGRDRKGKPVYLAYTNARGEYEVFLPAGTAGNVLVVSSVPGTTDGRLTARAFGNAARDARVELSELQSGVVDYLRALVQARLEVMLTHEARAFFPRTFPEPMIAGFLPTAEAIRAAGTRNGFAALPPAAQRRVAQRVADRIIAATAVFDAPVLPLIPEPTSVPAGQPAIEALLGSLSKVLEGSAKVLAAKGPAGFEGFGFFGLATQVHPAGASLAIRKPSDLLDVLNASFQAVPHEDFIDVSASSVVDLCVPAVEKDNIKDTIYSLYFAAVNVLFGPEGPAIAEDEMKKAIAAETARPGPAGPAPAPAVMPPAPAATVATLAGSGVPGGADGAGTAATFDRPAALAVAPDGTLFVAEQGATPRLRRVAPDGRVATLALAAPSPLVRPAGLAVGADGALYVADAGAHAIFVVRDPAAATPVLATLAGAPGEQGAAAAAVDGAAARFKGPEGLAFGPDGALYVADRGNHVVRRLETGGAARVTTWAGRAGEKGSRDDYGTAARFAEPVGLAFVKDGPLVVSEQDGGMVRRVRVAACEGGPAGEAGGVTVLAGGAARTSDGRTRLVDWAETRALMALGAKPAGVATAADGTVFVADTAAHVVRWFHPSLRWTKVLAGAPTAPAGFAEGDGAAARFSAPAGLAVAPDGKTVYVADAGNHRVRKITVGP